MGEIAKRAEYYLGIDPGLDGAFVMIDNLGKVRGYWKMPKGADNRVCPLGIIDVFREVKATEIQQRINMVIGLEKIWIITQASKPNNFSLGKYCGYLTMGLHALRLNNFTEIPARTWQKIMIGAPALSSFKTTKEAAFVAAKRICPDWDFKLSSKHKNPDSGIVDAYLIAEYMRKIHGT